MFEQRWPGDYETIPQEFANARMQEQMGMDGVNRSYGNDYVVTAETTPMDRYERGELDPSWATQLDTVGMQPHSREYLERDMTALRSDRKYRMIAGQMIDHTDGIQFSGRP